MHEMLIKQTHWEENKHILFQDHIAWKVERKQTFIWKRGETSWNNKNWDRSRIHDTCTWKCWT